MSHTKSQNLEIFTHSPKPESLESFAKERPGEMCNGKGQARDSILRDICSSYVDQSLFSQPIPDFVSDELVAPYPKLFSKHSTKGRMI
jgi:hypothetical protein